MVNRYIPTKKKDKFIPTHSRELKGVPLMGGLGELSKVSKMSNITQALKVDQDIIFINLGQPLNVGGHHPEDSQNSRK